MFSKWWIDLCNFYYIVAGYLLSKKEGQPGTPEKPLSDLGRVTYQAYWRSVILEYLYKYGKSKTLKIQDISQETGMYSHDIASTLQTLNMVRRNQEGKFVICVNWKLVEEHAQKLAQRKTKLNLDPECLRWTPLVTNQLNVFSDEKEVG